MSWTTGYMRQPQAAAMALGAFTRCRRAHVPLERVAPQAHKKTTKIRKNKNKNTEIWERRLVGRPQVRKKRERIKPQVRR